MACFSPLNAWQTFEGDIHFYAKGTSGKKGGKAPNYKRELTLPCGRCIGCKLERSRQWAVRLLHENQLHETSCFVTLTISPEHLHTRTENGSRPHSVWTKPKSAPRLPTLTTGAPNGLEGPNIAPVDSVDNHGARADRVPYAAGTRAVPSMAPPERRAGESLSIQDHQKFMKRLRKHLKQPVRFFMCGEYGDNLGRPHYHYIIFGHDFPDKYPWAKRNGNQTYRSASLEKLWPYGHCEIGEVNFETCAYVARYVTKKITGNKAEEHYLRTDENGTNYWLQPEFNAMSRKPGIAKEWFDQYRTDVYPHDHVIINEMKAKPPRYYDKLLEKYDAALLEEIQQHREQNAKHDDNTPERLAVRAKVTLARLNLKKRSLETQK